MKISIAGTGKIAEEVLRMLHKDFSGKIEVTGIYAREKSIEHAIDLCQAYAPTGFVFTDYARMLQEAEADFVYIANANHDIMVGGYKYFKASGVGKRLVPRDSYIFAAMNVVSEECTETSGFLTEARNTVNRRRGVKEVTKGNFDITNSKCIEIEKYTTNSIRKLVRKKQNGQYRRQLDPELAKEYAKNVRQTIEDTQKNMAKDKNTALNAGKSKEVPVKGARKSI